MKTPANTTDFGPVRGKRRLRFGLRTLLIAIAVIAVLLGLAVNSAERQRRVVRHIADLGGVVRYEYQFRGGIFRADLVSGIPTWLNNIIHEDFIYNVVWVDVSNTHVTDEDIPCIASLRRLECFRASNSAISDNGVAALVGLRRLRELNVAHTRITDSGLAPVSRLVSLDHLNISGTRITNGGIGALEESARLRFLNFAGTVIDDGVFDALRRLTHLRGVHFAGSRVDEMRFHAEFPYILIWP